MSEPADAKLKRLTMRSSRRGMKEMDLILGPYAKANLHAMSDAELGEYDTLLSENDQDLYAWITGAAPVPAGFSGLIGRISAFAADQARAARLSAS